MLVSGQLLTCACWYERGPVRSRADCPVLCARRDLRPAGRGAR